MRDAPVSSPHGSLLASRTEILTSGLTRELETALEKYAQIAELLTLSRTLSSDLTN